MGLTNLEAERLQEILELLTEHTKSMREHEKKFVDDQIARYDERGADMRLSGPQWNWLNGLYERFSK